MTPTDLASTIARVREAVRLTGVSHMERYEAQAERFYRETGLMAPGKSVPLGMPQRDEERGPAWDAFQGRLRDEWKRDILTLIREVERVS